MIKLSHIVLAAVRRAAAGSLAATFAGALLMSALPLPASGQTRETLGAGDTIRVTVFQNPDLNTETRISERGTIVFPLIGEITLSGQTPAGAGLRIADQLKSRNFMKDPQVTVTLLQVRSRQVSVLGNIVRPGRYALDESNMTLTDILALAGGIGPEGADSVTVIAKRNGTEQKLEVNIAEMMRKGDMSRNFEIENGDMVYVHRAPMFYIYGEVQRAGAYRLEPNMAVMHALSVGGGLTQRGTARGLQIHRRMPNGSVRRFDAQLTDQVQPDDLIFVRESLL